MWIILASSLAFLPFQRRIAVILLCVATGIAFTDGVVSSGGLSILLAIAVLALLYVRFGRQIPWVAVIGEVLLLIAAVALFLHLVPGFNNLKVIDKVQVGAQSAPFSMYFNLDKAWVTFILLAALPSLFICQRTLRKQIIRQQTHQAGSWPWVMLIIAVPALLLLAVALGGLRIEPHFPRWLGSFMLANLFFVSLAEEALFRGYLQQRLSGWLGDWPALIIASLLFGAAHFAGGTMLVIFATLSGVIYGLAWMLSGRLWVATLFHFGLNLCHLLLFTYPLYRAAT